jgi:hypothetical protein
MHNTARSIEAVALEMDILWEIYIADMRISRMRQAAAFGAYNKILHEAHGEAFAGLSRFTKAL